MQTLNTTITKISIIESSKSWTKQLLVAIQKEEDMQFLSAYSNAEDALRKIVRLQPDIVIIGISLSQMNGIACMMRILQKAPNISFLMFTRYEHSKYVFASLKGGASGYILKKEGVEAAIEGIKKLKAGDAPMSRNIARKVLKSFRPSEKVVQKISTREREILNLLSKGYLYKEIASELNPQITEGTVKQHIHRIYRKLQVNNRTEAINKYLKYV